MSNPLLLSILFLFQAIPPITSMTMQTPGGVSNIILGGAEGGVGLFPSGLISNILNAIQDVVSKATFLLALIVVLIIWWKPLLLAFSIILLERLTSPKLAGNLASIAKALMHGNAGKKENPFASTVVSLLPERSGQREVSPARNELFKFSNPWRALISINFGILYLALIVSIFESFPFSLIFPQISQSFTFSLDTKPIPIPFYNTSLNSTTSNEFAQNLSTTGVISSIWGLLSTLVDWEILLVIILFSLTIINEIADILVMVSR